MAILGKYLILFGVIMIAVGLLLSYSGNGIGLFHLPGDIVVKRERFTLYFPVVTSVVLSIVFSLIFWLAAKFLNR